MIKVMKTKKEAKVISPHLFTEYTMCPAWIYHDIYTDEKSKGELSELTLKLMEQGVLHEKEIIKDLKFDEVKVIESEKAVAETLKLMKNGVERIYQGTLEKELNGLIWRGRPDLLERIPGKSKFGNYFYIPVEIKSSKEPRPEHKHQLAFYARLLEEVQEHRPELAAIINTEKERLEIEISDETMQKMMIRANEIIQIIKGRKPTPHLRSGCRRESPWGHLCIEECEKANDAALIYNIRETTLDKLRNAGYETVADLAKLDSSSPELKISPKTWRQIVEQARSLQEDKIIWLNKPNIPESDYKIYFDIEGDPLLGVEYLFGFWLGEEQKFKYFLAEKPEDEEKMWREFLAWLPTLPKDYIVYHYADYEKTVLRRLAERYGSSPELDIFMDESRLIDLLRIVKESVIFPLYFYSIKDLAKSRFVNYKWRHQKAGGAQSIFWYESWLATGDKKILQDIIDYNEDDVVATEHLFKWLKENSPK